MIRRVERASKVKEVVVVSATCDRCGRELQRVTGVGVDYKFPFRGVAIQGRIYAKSGYASDIQLLEAEICEVCTEALVDWIGSANLLDREFTYERLDAQAC